MLGDYQIAVSDQSRKSFCRRGLKPPCTAVGLGFPLGLLVLVRPILCSPAKDKGVVDFWKLGHSSPLKGGKRHYCWVEDDDQYVQRNRYAPQGTCPKHQRTSVCALGRHLEQAVLCLRKHTEVRTRYGKEW